MSKNLKLDGFKLFCLNASDAQLQNIYHKEDNAGRKPEATVAKKVAESRGIYFTLGN